MIQYLYFNVLQTSEAKSFFFTFNFLTKITKYRKSMKNNCHSVVQTGLIFLFQNFPISFKKS